jgi:hypothetical protein
MKCDISLDIDEDLAMGINFIPVYMQPDELQEREEQVMPGYYVAILDSSEGMDNVRVHLKDLTRYETQEACAMACRSLQYLIQDTL